MLYPYEFRKEIKVDEQNNVDRRPKKETVAGRQTRRFYTTATPVFQLLPLAH